jgi:hypothetical protein
VQARLIRVEHEEESPPERRFKRTDDPAKRRDGAFGRPPSAEVLAKLPDHTMD